MAPPRASRTPATAHAFAPARAKRIRTLSDARVANARAHAAAKLPRGFLRRPTPRAPGARARRAARAVARAARAAALGCARANPRRSACRSATAATPPSAPAGLGARVLRRDQHTREAVPLSGSSAAAGKGRGGRGGPAAPPLPGRALCRRARARVRTPHDG